MSAVQQSGIFPQFAQSTGIGGLAFPSNMFNTQLDANVPEVKKSQSLLIMAMIAGTVILGFSLYGRR
ncbi:MAG: hypothetical protein ACK5QX_04100 [bacterium]|jgi:hypothetical protein